MSATESNASSPTIKVLLELSDDRLILGHRLSEWCGVGPMIEEDIALGNIALDLIGHATHGLGIVAQARGGAASADSLAFLRDADEFRNIQLVEQLNVDFAVTMVRQFLFDSYNLLLLELLSVQENHGDAELAGWATKCHKEDLYHLRHSRQWMLRLGDGTAESNGYAQSALEDLWRFTGELITPSEALKTALGENASKLTEIEQRWRTLVSETLAEAKLTFPKNSKIFGDGGRSGKHTEHLSRLLATMQVLPRAYPGAQW